MSVSRTLIVGGRTLSFPAYFPVTTFGGAYPLDDLLRPYLPRLAQAAMVSYHYAQQMPKTARPGMPLLIDSGGFACLFEHSRVVATTDPVPLGEIEVEREEGTERITPMKVLAFQETHADLAFTLDFPIPPGTDPEEAALRRTLTVNNALWALKNRRRRDMPLFACIQGWDETSFLDCAIQLIEHDFDGFAIGGLVPRVKDWDLVTRVVKGIRALTDKPLHVFGIGRPELVKALFALGVDSVDSSSFVKAAADGKSWADPHLELPDPSPVERLHLALTNLAQASATTLPLSCLNFSAAMGKRMLIKP